MTILVRMEVKRFVRCVCCNSSLWDCEKFIQVFTLDRKQVKGERYCIHCEAYARMNNDVVGPVFNHIPTQEEVLRMLRDNKIPVSAALALIA